MKLIIDIDEDVRIAISRMGLLRISDEIQKKVDRAIQHGTPLDKIRADITALKSHHINDCYDDGFQGCRTNVLHILDKYKAESEDKE